jgi:hypothetical protein
LPAIGERGSAERRSGKPARTVSAIQDDHRSKSADSSARMFSPVFFNNLLGSARYSSHENRNGESHGKQAKLVHSPP